MRKPRFATCGAVAVPFALLCATACTDSSQNSPTQSHLDGDPYSTDYIPAPAMAARFAAAHGDVAPDQRLTMLRARIYVDSTGHDAIEMSGVTDDGADVYRVTDPDGTVHEYPMPSWTITPETIADIAAAGDALDHVTDTSQLDGIGDRLEGDLAANTAGDYADYQDDLIADGDAFCGTGGSGGNGGNGGNDGGGGGGGGGGPPGAPHLRHNLGNAVCTLDFAATIVAHGVAAAKTGAAIINQIKNVAEKCKGGPITAIPCVIEIMRLVALKTVMVTIPVHLIQFTSFAAAVNDWVIAIQNAQVGAQANAGGGDAAEAEARGAAVKGIGVRAFWFAPTWSVLLVAAGLTGYPSVVTSVGAMVGLAAAFISCSWIVVNPFWQNAGVKVQVNQGAPAGGAPPAGGGGGGGGGPPMPRQIVSFDPGGKTPVPRSMTPGVADGGPGFPGFPDDAHRNPRIMPLLTSLPEPAAPAQMFTVDLQAQQSPFGTAMDNLESRFSLQSQGEVWGLQLCSKLIPDRDTGGPYLLPDGSTWQYANTPYYNYSQGFGNEGYWVNGVNLTSTSIPTGYATLTQQHVCDGDDNNDGVPDAQQGASYCFDQNGDGREDLYFVSLDSDMPNRYPDRTINCGGVGLDLIPKPQIGTIPGVDPRDAVNMLAGREVTQTTIVHFTSPYRNVATGAKIGNSGMLMFKVKGRLHLPDDPCVKYDQIYNPYYVQYGWVHDYSKPGCGLGGPI